MGTKKKRIPVYVRLICGCCHETLYFDSVESAAKAFDSELGPPSVSVTDDRGVTVDGVDLFYGYAFDKEEMQSRGLLHLLSIDQEDRGETERLGSFEKFVEGYEGDVPEEVQGVFSLVRAFLLPVPTSLVVTEMKGSAAFVFEWVNDFDVTLYVFEDGTVELAGWLSEDSEYAEYPEVTVETLTQVFPLRGTGLQSQVCSLHGMAGRYSLQRVRWNRAGSSSLSASRANSAEGSQH